MYFKEFNLFKIPVGDGSEKAIDFDNFKKSFFPHLYLVQDELDDAEEKAAKLKRVELH